MIYDTDPMEDSKKSGVGMSIFSDPDVTRIGQPQAEPARPSVQLPLRILLVSDLQPHETVADWTDSARVTSVDKNSFAGLLQELAPRLSIEVANKITDSPGVLDVDLAFSRLEDFHPEQVARQLPAVRQLLETRALVNDLKRGRLEPDAFRTQIRKSGVDQEWAQQLYEALTASERPARSSSPSQKPSGDDAVDRLLGMVDLGGNDAKERHEPDPGKKEERHKPDPGTEKGGFMGALVQAVADSTSDRPHVERSIADVLVADLDEIIAAQLNTVLGHPSFRHLEAAWRGLKMLVDRIDFRKNIQLDVLPATRDALSEAMYYQVLIPEHSDDRDQAPLSAVFLDYSFGNGQADITLLEDLAETGASLQVPIIASAAASFFGVTEPTGLDRIPSLGQHVEGPQYIQWNKLREKDDARHLALVVPPVLLRSAYGAEHPVEAFEFEETGELWGGGALAVAAVIAGSFARTGWPTHLHGNGDNRIEGLPVRKTAGGHAPLAAMLPERKQNELADAGFVVLGCRMNSDQAFVTHAPTVRRAGTYDSVEAGDEMRSHLSLSSQLFVARAAQFLLAFQKDVAPGTHFEQVRTELSSRLVKLFGASGQTVPADAVNVEHVPQDQFPDHELLEIRLRPPTSVLNEQVSLVMRLLVSS